MSSNDSSWSSSQMVSCCGTAPPSVFRGVKELHEDASATGRRRMLCKSAILTQ
jgi:hypothetical protein